MVSGFMEDAGVKDFGVKLGDLFYYRNDLFEVEQISRLGSAPPGPLLVVAHRVYDYIPIWRDRAHFYFSVEYVRANLTNDAN